jgi:F-type H+-transporting ATPase subunit epsilon
MHLRVLLPTHVLVDEDVVRVVAEAENGSFGILPRHADYLAALRPGLLVFESLDGREAYVGHDVGILVKRGRQVFVSIRNGVRGDDLSALRGVIEHEFVALDHRERAARTALARLEAGVVRRFIELEERG